MFQYSFSLTAVYSILIRIKNEISVTLYIFHQKPPCNQPWMKRTLTKHQYSIDQMGLRGHYMSSCVRYTMYTQFKRQHANQHSMNLLTDQHLHNLTGLRKNSLGDWGILVYFFLLVKELTQSSYCTTLRVELTTQQSYKLSYSGAKNM